TTCGTMPLLDSHVLELSFRSLHTLLRRHPDNAAIHGMVYAINLTADTLLADDFVRRVETLLAREDLDPNRLCFEITEQAAVRNLEVVTSAMQRLRGLGIRFSLDDFGAGMTSLSHLRDLPLDYVKIDKAFIWRVQGDPSSRMTVEFVVRLGRELGFEIIAEGVEDLPLLFYLRDLGVTIAQGYVTSIPSLFDPLSPEPVFSRCGRELLGDRLALLG
ncbi:MAG: EAL domain-containing protein, partial [Cyanobium sp.]